jgi:hypothetical protein
MAWRRSFAVTVAAVASLALVGAAQAHVLTMPRAANANKFVTREVCESIVDDPALGTCSKWTSGPCRRVSAHRVRCPFTHKLDHEDGSQFLCRQVAEWFISEGSGSMESRILPGSTSCRPLRPPDPVVP